MIAPLDDNAEPRWAEYGGEPPRPFQAQSYSDLLHFPFLPVSSKRAFSDIWHIAVPIVDAIIVPTIRSAEQLSSAVELAARARCQLIPLYTDNFPAGLSSVLSRLKWGAPIPLALRSDLNHHLLDLDGDIPQSLVYPGALDISRKRNLGLLIGHMCGWTRMLFLDDDIRRLSIEKLTSAATLLDRYPVVGLQVNKFPDASAVGHARRLTGRRQEPFISGGSLLVNPQRLNGLFLPVYHEDWLCIIDHLRLGEVAVGGTVGQLPYRPFTTPERATLEEFGDILASGLLWLVHARHRTGTAELTNRYGNSAITYRHYWQAVVKVRFWEEILNQRAALLDNIAARLKQLNLPDPSPLPSLDCSTAALQ